MDGEHKLLNLIDLHTRRKFTEENNEKSRKPSKNDAKEEENTKHVGKLFIGGTTNQRKKEENSC